ncbi:MAG: hypothetical protein NT007_09415 [Candidatus Kapabacteria bacterium]|nr:hypothetical protein [Candidatus Kapabacteria bacterium]
MSALRFNGKMKFIIIIIIINFQVTLSQSTAIEEDLNEKYFYESNLSNYENPEEYYKFNPVFFKKATFLELSRLPGMSFESAKKIFYYKTNNPTCSLIELTGKLNLNAKETESLNNYTDLAKIDNLFVRYRARNYINIDEIQTDSTNQIQNYYLYQQIYFKYQGISFALINKKNIGESSFLNNINSFFEYKYNDQFKILIGDYHLNEGLGAILHNSVITRKSSDVINSALNFDDKISGLTTNQAVRYFRGICFNSKFHLSDLLKLSTSLFYSQKKLSAIIDSNSIVSSIYLYPVFKDSLMISRKNNLMEQAIGAVISGNYSYFSLGFSGYYLNYDKIIHVDNFNSLQGQSSFFSSIFAKTEFANTSFETELARDYKNNYALIAAIVQHFNNFYIALNYRNLQDQFCSPYGARFGENSVTGSERGFYSGFRWFNKNFDIKFYYDIFSTYNFSNPFPSKGNDILAEISNRIDDKTSLAVRFYYHFINRIYYNNQIFETNSDNETKYQWRIDLSSWIKDNFQLKFRFSYNLILNNTQHQDQGFGFYSEFQYNILKNLKAITRISYYSTDSYQSSIWQTESCIPGIFALKPLYGNGERFLVLLNYSPIHQINLWFKFTLDSKNQVYGYIPTNPDRLLTFQFEYVY